MFKVYSEPSESDISSDFSMQSTTGFGLDCTVHVIALIDYCFY